MSVTVEDVRKIVAGYGPVRLRLGKTNCFAGAESGKPHDVVYVEVVGEDIEKLNWLMKAKLPHVETHKSYIPHICLAYVKAGAGKKYVGLDDVDGLEVLCRTLVFSDRDKKRTQIEIDGPPYPFDESESIDEWAEKIGTASPEQVNAWRMALAGKVPVRIHQIATEMERAESDEQLRDRQQQTETTIANAIESVRLSLNDAIAASEARQARQIAEMQKRRPVAVHEKLELDADGNILGKKVDLVYAETT